MFVNNKEVKFEFKGNGYNFRVYVIYVTWSDGSTNVIYRRYSRFFDFQSKVTDMFPEEAGTLDPRKRIIPFLPGKKFFGRSHIREVALKRMTPIAEYCRAIVKLPRKISQSKEVVEFFDLEPDDIDPPKERKKASIKGNKISMPKALEHYVAVTEYKKQEKGEITLKVGMLVEVVEKTETGWWFVSVEDEQGWVPSTCLEREDGVKEETSQRFKPGEEEQYLCTEEFKPEGEDELGLERGAVVDVIEKNLEGWWIVRYNGKEGYVPATYLMKSEAFSMKKQKVARTSVGGPEIVKTLHDISDLLKEEPKEEPEQKSFTIHELSKILKEDKRGTAETDQVYECIESVKSRSLKRGGSVRPPPRPSIKPKRDEPVLPKKKVPLTHADSFLKEYVTIADFSDSVGDGINFQAGESVRVLEKSDGGWWYIEIGEKEGWAPSAYLQESLVGELPRSFDTKDDNVLAETAEDSFDSDSDSETESSRRSSNMGDLANALKAKLTKTKSKPLPPAPAKKDKVENIDVKQSVENVDVRKSGFKNIDVKADSHVSDIKGKQPPDPPKKTVAGIQDIQTDDSKPAFSVQLKHVEKETTRPGTKSKPDQTQKVPLRMGQPPPPPPPPNVSEHKETPHTNKSQRPSLPVPGLKPTEKKNVPSESKIQTRSDNIRKSQEELSDIKPNVKGLAGALKAKFESDTVRPTSTSDTTKTAISSDVSRTKFGEGASKPGPGALKPVPKLTDKPKISFGGANDTSRTNKTTEKEVVSGGKVSDLASVLKSKLENRQSIGEVTSQNHEDAKSRTSVSPRPVTVLKPNIGTKPARPVTPPSPKTQHQTGHTAGVRKSPLSTTEIRDSTSSLNEDSVNKLNALLGGKDSKDLDPQKYSARPLPPKPHGGAGTEDVEDTSKSSIPAATSKPTPNLPVKPNANSHPKPEFKHSNAFKGDSDEPRSAGVAGLASALKAKLETGKANTPSTGFNKPDLKPPKPAVQKSKPITAIKPKSEEKAVHQTVSDNGLVRNSEVTEDVYSSIADFPGENEGEISLKIGQEVRLLEKADGWWYVTYDSKKGWAPASYFEQVRPNRNTVVDQVGVNKPKPSQYKQAVFRTCSDFSAENEGELSFTSGEDVTVLEKPEGGWWYVQIGRNEGWVPEAYLEEIMV